MAQTDVIGQFFRFIVSIFLALFGVNNNTTKCDVNGPILPTLTNTVMRFVAFGDTPYDGRSLPPLYTGTEYACVQNTMIPGINNNLATTIDFVAHIGDIKAGGSRMAGVCNDTLFANRRDLFQTLEQSSGGVDFLLIPGGAYVFVVSGGRCGGDNNAWCDVNVGHPHLTSSLSHTHNSPCWCPLLLCCLLLLLSLPAPPRTSTRQ
jgi:hypothetical protein